MIVVISEPIRQLSDYFDGRRQAIYTDQQTGHSSYFLVLARYLKVCIKSGIPCPTLFIVDKILYRLAKGEWGASDLPEISISWVQFSLHADAPVFLRHLTDSVSKAA
jgi:hypothetical protein